MSSQNPGPFDRLLASRREPEREAPAEQTDRAAIYVGGTIIGLAILLLVLILPPVSILSGDGNGENANAGSSGPAISDKYSADPRGGTPKLPAGLAAASRMYDLSAPSDGLGPAGVTVPVREDVNDARDLGLYTYTDGRWQRLSDVTLIAGGAAARGEVGELPGNVAVLRRTGTTLQVAGSAGAGTTIDERAVPALTVLHPIVFIPGADGSVGGTPPAVPPAAYTVVPGIVSPDPTIVDAILRSDQLRTAHAVAIAEKVESGNYAGISIDYRAVNPALREQFTSFVQALGEALDEKGRTLTLTLPMPARTEGEFDTGAYDWEKLGAAADSIEMAGELDQELYFQNTEAALEYVLDRVDKSKLLLTVTSMSVERGGDGLRAMPLESALALASTAAVKTETEIVAGSPVQLVAQNLAQGEGASGMLWDEAARAVTFSYPGRGGKRTVWLANHFSAAFRVELAQRFGLAGVAVDNVALEDGAADVWTPIRELSDTGSLTLSKPNADRFAPQWSAAQGTLSATSGDAVTWTAPQEPGSYEIALTVSDGVVRVEQRFSLEVVAAPPPAESE
jgi:hypothetical protein